MALSCLVISRTPALLNRLLASLPAARSHWDADDEVLCSWNGTIAAEADLDPRLGPCPAGRPAFRVAQREPYHFASNMNGLARRARGDRLLLVNDDVVLDPGCLDQAEAVLEEHPDAAVVGGLLRTSQGLLGHAGLLFDADHHPFNRCRPELGPLVAFTSPELLASGPIPAVTGALMLLRRADLLAVPLRETFQHCGEDVALCLDLRRQLGRTAYYASTVTALHDEKSTRGHTADAADLQAVAAIAGPQLASDPTLLALQHQWQAREAAWITERAVEQVQATASAERALAALRHDLQQRQIHWQQERLALIAQREDLRQQLLATWASHSWRITRPLRLLGRLCRRLLHRAQA
jgi:hypothetical protein